jgi:stage III sporulation protein SpoIIIAA
VLVREIERCEVQSETRYLREKRVEVTPEACEIEGCEIGEPFEEVMKKRACWITDSE